jgi:arginyl-tRNA synthetase
MKQLGSKGFTYDAGAADLSLLTNSYEQAVITSISKYPEIVEHAALARAPHALVTYLRELATDFHGAYAAGNENAELRFIVEDAELRDARLTLVLAARQVIRNGLGLLGVSAPESM